MRKILCVFVFHCCAQAQYVSQVWCPDNGDGTYTNPVLYADYSDPDVCVVGERQRVGEQSSGMDYYLTASSFNCIPGLPILHSKDLVNWTIIGYALQEQVPKGVEMGWQLAMRSKSPYGPYEWKRVMWQGKWIGAKFGFVAECRDRKSNRGRLDIDWIRIL